MSLLYRVRTKQRFLVFSLLVWGLPIASCLIVWLGVYRDFLLTLYILFAGALGAVVFAELAWRMGFRDFIESNLPYMPEMRQREPSSSVQASSPKRTE
jgi:hypothetical protein